MDTSSNPLSLLVVVARLWPIWASLSLYLRLQLRPWLYRWLARLSNGRRLLGGSKWARPSSFDYDECHGRQWFESERNPDAKFEREGGPWKEAHGSGQFAMECTVCNGPMAGGPEIAASQPAIGPSSHPARHRKVFG